MSGDAGYADIIILALVAGFILLRLRSILGKHTDLPQPMEMRREATAREERPVPGPREEPEPEENEEDFVGGENSQALSQRLKEVKRLDPSFRVSQFLEGARAAFDMILESFSQGDRKTLKFLLSGEVYQNFTEALKTAQAGGRREETTLIAIKSADITEVEIDGTVVRITVQIASEQVTLVRDAAGTIVEGDPSNIELVTDNWTFERDTRSSDPNWKLVATEA